MVAIRSSRGSAVSLPGIRGGVRGGGGGGSSTTDSSEGIGQGIGALLSLFAGLAGEAKAKAADRDKRMDQFVLETQIGEAVERNIEGTKARQDTQFQGFSPSEDRASMQRNAVVDNLINRGYDPEQTIDALEPAKGQSLANFMAIQESKVPTPTAQELASGYEGPAPQDVTDIPFSSREVQDRELFGEQSFNHVQGLISETTENFEGDLAGLARYTNSNIFKEQLTQAKSRDRDVVAGDVANQAARVAKAKQVFQAEIDVETTRIRQLRAEEIAIRGEGRALKAKLEEEKRLKKTVIDKEGRANLQKLIETRAKESTDKRGEIRRSRIDMNNRIIHNEMDEGQEIRKESRLQSNIRAENKEKSKAMSHLEANFSENLIDDPDLSRQDAMETALEDLKAGQRVFISEAQIKRLQEAGVYRVSMLDPDTGKNTIFEFELDGDGKVIKDTKTKIGLDKIGLGGQLNKLLQATTKAKTENQLIELEVAKGHLDILEKYIEDPEVQGLLTTLGGLDFWIMKQRDRSRFFPLDPKGKATLAKFTRMANMTGQVFTTFRKEVTGVAGPPEEFERLEDISLSISKQGETGFRAALGLLQFINNEERQLLHLALSQGLLKTPKQKAEFRIQQGARMQLHINELEDKFPKRAAMGHANFDNKLKERRKNKQSQKNPSLNSTLNFLNQLSGD
jgi:hypothetical protein